LVPPDGHQLERRGCAPQSLSQSPREDPRSRVSIVTTTDDGSDWMVGAEGENRLHGKPPEHRGGRSVGDTERKDGAASGLPRRAPRRKEADGSLAARVP
jgi:hypothetical protein